MSREHLSYLDGKLIDTGVHVVQSKIKELKSLVSIKAINKISSALIRQLASWDIQESKLLWVDHVVPYILCRLYTQWNTSKVKSMHVTHFIKFSCDVIKVLTYMHGVWYFELLNFVWVSASKLVECITCSSSQEVILNCNNLYLRCHKASDKNGSSKEVSDIIILKAYMLQAIDQRNCAANSL